MAGLLLADRHRGGGRRRPLRFGDRGAHARPKSKAWAFQEAKRFIYLGAACGFLILFVGFTAVGGEWFAMWDTWNGQQAAFRICVFILLALIFVARPDAELAARYL